MRTDVPAGTLAKLVVGEGFHQQALGWIFKFHGVDPGHYQDRTVTSWLGGSATVQVEKHAAYLKLDMKKPFVQSLSRSTGVNSALFADSVALPIDGLP